MSPSPTLRSVSLAEALDDPNLFGSAIQLYPKQRDLLLAVAAGPRLHVQAIGRRSGKTLMSAIYALYSCLLRPDLDDRVAPGTVRYAAAVATNLQQARLFVSSARAIIERSPALASCLVGGDADELRFKLPWGARTALRAFPCSSRGTRGWAISTLVMDEAAFFLSETEGPQVADAVFKALVPSTATFGDEARILILSTPFGSDGLFAELFHRADAGELSDAKAHRATTAEMNPTVDAAFLLREEQLDPISFRAEYLAEFLGSGAAYLDFDRFHMADHLGLPPEAGTGWICGLDPAVAADTFGIAVVGRSVEDRSKLVLGYIDGLKPAKSVTQEERSAVTEALLANVSDVCNRFRATAVTDQHLAKIVQDRLSRDGISVRQHNMTATSKTQVFSELRARLYGGTLEIFDEPQLVAELRRLRTKFSAGSASIVNPRVGGSHGDRAQALALATFEHRFGGGTGRMVVGESHGYRSPEGWLPALSSFDARDV